MASIARWLSFSLVFFSVLGCSDTDGDGTRDGRDCAPDDPAIHLDAEEVCDGIDNNCNGQVDEDVAFVAYWDRDGDGFGDPGRARRVCELPEDGVEQAGDCNDDDPLTYEGAPEVCDEVDNDCDGEIDEGVKRTFYVDADGDDRGSDAETTEACFVPPGFAGQPDDCDDSEPEAWTGRGEICDQIDNDCDGSVDEDVVIGRYWADGDGDGFGDPTAEPVLSCGPGPGVADNALDCDDADPAKNPDTLDVRGNGLDDDCDGFVDEYGIGPNEEFATFGDLDLETIPVNLNDEVVIQFSAGTHVVNVDTTSHDKTNWTLAGAGCERTTLVSAGAGSVVQVSQASVAEMTIAAGTGSSVELGEEHPDRGPYVMGGGILVLGRTYEDESCNEKDAPPNCEPELWPEPRDCVDGDIYCVQIRDVCVVNNSATGRGGGVAVATGKARIVDSRLEGNGAGRSGGGAYAHPGAELFVDRTVVDSNVAASNGGGIAVLGGRGVVTNSVVAGNTCTANTGCGVAFIDIEPDGTRNDGATGEVSYVTFHANRGSGALRQGVALVAEQSVVHVADSLFTDHPDDVSVTAFETDVCQDDAFNLCAQGGSPSSCPSSCEGGCRLTFERVGFARNAGFDTGVRFPDEGARNRLGWVPDRQGGDVRYIRGGTERPEAGWDLRLREGSELAGLGAYAGAGAPVEDPPLTDDFDGDGVPYADELAGGTNPWVADADLDTDGDGLDVLAELAAGTDPGRADTDGDGVTDDVDGVPVDPRDQAPVADAGPARAVAWVGEAVAISAQSSFDPQGTALGVSWSLLGPGGSSATIADPTAVDTTFTPDLAGTYTITLVVDDGAATAAHTREVVAFAGVRVPTDHATIALALANAPGQVIGLEPGVYAERVETDVTLVGLGTDASQVVLQGDGQAPVLSVSGGARVRLVNLTVTGGVGDEGGGIVVRRSQDLELDGVVVRENHARRGGGLFVEATPVLLRDTVFADNTADLEGGALFLAGEGQAFDVVGSTFAQNAADRGGAVFVQVGERCFDSPVAFDGRFDRVRWAFNQARDGAAVAFEGPAGRIRIAQSDVVGQAGGGGVFLTEGAALTVTSSAFVGNVLPLVTGRTASYASFGGSLAFDNLGDLPSGEGFVEEPPRWALVTDDAELDEVLAGVLGSGLRDAGIGHDRDGSQADIGSCGGPEAPPRCLRFGRDAEGDGLDDGWEIHFGLDPTLDDRAANPDGDGLDSAAELLAGTDPTDADSDEDGVDDATEVAGADDPTDDADHRPVAAFTAALDDATGLVTLDASGSTDPQSTPLSLAWTLDRPLASTAVIAPPGGVTASFTADELAARYRVTLEASDGTATSRPVRVHLAPPRVLALSDFASLEGAVALAGPFDVIVLPPETVVSGPIDVDGVVRLRGQPGTEIVPREPGASLFQIGRGDRLELAGLTVRGGNAFRGSAAFCSRGEIEARQVVFRDHVAQIGPVVFGDGCAVSFTDVDLLGNWAERDAGALHLEGGTLAWTRGHAIANRAGKDGGVARLVGVQADLRNLVFSGNDADRGRALRITNGEEFGPLFEPEPSTYAHLTIVGNGSDRDDSIVVSFDGAIDTIHRITDSVFADNGIDTGVVAFPFREILANSGREQVTADRVAFDRPGARAVLPNDVLGDEILGEVVNLGFGDPPGLDFRISALSAFRDQGPGLDRDGSPSDWGAFGGPDAPDGWDLYQIDTDGDGLDDGWEILVGLDPTTADDPDLDLDGDGRTTRQEYGPIPVGPRQVRSDPLVADTDSDGLDDGEEFDAGRDPTVPDLMTTVTFEPGEVVTTPGIPATVLATLTADVDPELASASWRIVHQPPLSTLGSADLLQVDDLAADRSELSLSPQVPGRIVLGVVFETLGGERTAEATVTVWVDGDLEVPGAYDEVQDAIADVSPNSTVVVGPGEWTVNAVRGVSTALRGAGPGVTVLSGGGTGPVLQLIEDEEPTEGFLTLRLEGVTLTDGRGILGGALSLRPDTGGGEAYLTDVTVEGNEALEGGGIYLQLSNLIARGLRVVDNVATRRGGGLALVSPSSTRRHEVAQSIIAGNDVRAVGFRGQGGGAFLRRSLATFTNVILANNVADDGGAIAIEGFRERPGGLTLQHVTGTNNAASRGSFLWALDIGTSRLDNSILAEQRESSDLHLREADSEEPVDLAVAYTLLVGDRPPFDLGGGAGITQGAGNQIGLPADPGFVNLEPPDDWFVHDWLLDPAVSTAIGAGPSAGGTGLTGDTGPLVDLGAFGGPEGSWDPRQPVTAP